MHLQGVKLCDKTNTLLATCVWRWQVISSIRASYSEDRYLDGPVPNPNPANPY